MHPSEHIIDYLGFVTLEELCEESEYVASLDSGVLINAVISHSWVDRPSTNSFPDFGNRRNTAMKLAS